MGNGHNGVCIEGIGNVLKGNLVSDNKEQGVLFTSFSYNNVVQNNLIGLQSDGLTPLPNSNSGIIMLGNAKEHTIGPDNKIWYNGEFGVELVDTTVSRITITQNSIFGNMNGGIALSKGANDSIAAPTITEKSPLSGTAPPNCTIEIFSDSLTQGRIYEGSATSDENGNWTWTGELLGPSVTVTATDQVGNTSAFSSNVVVSVEEDETAKIPDEFYLSQNFPNPFNPETTIQFGVKKSCRVVLKVYDVLGREVEKLVDENYQPGQYRINFKAFELSTGLYFYEILMQDFRQVKKMVVLR